MTTTATTYYRLTEWHGYGDDTPTWDEALNRAYVRLDAIASQRERGSLVPLEVVIDERIRTDVRDDAGVLVRGTDIVGRRFKLALEFRS